MEEQLTPEKKALHASRQRKIFSWGSNDERFGEDWSSFSIQFGPLPFLSTRGSWWIKVLRFAA